MLIVVVHKKNAANLDNNQLIIFVLKRKNPLQLTTHFNCHWFFKMTDLKTDIVEEVMTNASIVMHKKVYRSSTCLNFRLPEKIRCENCTNVYSKLITKPNYKRKKGRDSRCTNPWNAGKFEGHRLSHKVDRYLKVQQYISSLTGVPFSINFADEDNDVQEEEQDHSTQSFSAIIPVDNAIVPSNDSIGGEESEEEEQEYFTPENIVPPLDTMTVTPSPKQAEEKKGNMTRLTVYVQPITACTQEKLLKQQI